MCSRKWTDADRIAQNKKRKEDTQRRRSMLNWSKSEKGKAARKRYMENGGLQRFLEWCAKGGPAYDKKQAKIHQSIKDAEKSRVPWTIAEEQKLLELVKSGFSATVIAKIMSRSIRAIERKRESLKNG